MRSLLFVRTSLLLLLIPCLVNGAKKTQQQTQEQETAKKNKVAFESLGISDSDIDRMEDSVRGRMEPAPLTPGEEYVQEKMDENDSDELRIADSWYQQGLKYIERGRPQGTEGRRAAYQLFDQAATAGHKDARKVMGFAHLFGDNARWSINESRSIFTQLAQGGSADAQLALGFMYASGVGVSKSNQAKALVYYTFSALGGNPLAQMALGYRYYSGVGVSQSCEQALLYYEEVAKKVAESVKFSTGLAIQRIRLTDELEPTSTSQSTSPMDHNLLEYYRFLADKGDVSAQLGLGQLFLTGGRGVEQNFDEANRYLTQAAEAGNAGAFAYLGKMYLDGTPSTPQDNVTAFQFFLKSADKSNQIGQAGLGMMYLQGRGVKRDYDKALRLFTLAAEQGWVDGQLYLGIMHYQGLGVPRDFKKAVKFLQLASQNGHVLAYYNLAHMHATGVGVARSCQTAVEFYKNVAERGRWTEKIMEAYSAYKEKRSDEAALKYLFMAELGYEQAQSNFAYILDKDEARSLFPERRQELLQRALVHWKRAANQEYALARVKLGDYYYYGYGTDPDYEQAAYQYKLAADRHGTAQAFFNLGYMHEQGLGISQDLHLAKRFYDQAAEHSPDALVPVYLALMKLGILFIMNLIATSRWGIVLSDLDESDSALYGVTAALILAVFLLRRHHQMRQQQQIIHEHQD